MRKFTVDQLKAQYVVLGELLEIFPRKSQNKAAKAMRERQSIILQQLNQLSEWKKISHTAQPPNARLKFHVEDQ